MNAQNKAQKAGTTASGTPVSTPQCDSAVLRGDAVAKIRTITDSNSEVSDLVTSLVERNNKTYVYGSFLVKDPGDQSFHPLMAEVEFDSDCGLVSAVVLPAVPEAEPSITPSTSPSVSPSASPSASPAP